MPVLYDATGLFPRTLRIADNAYHLVLGRGDVLVYKQQYDDSSFQQAIERELAR